MRAAFKIHFQFLLRIALSVIRRGKYSVQLSQETRYADNEPLLLHNKEWVDTTRNYQE